MIHRRWNTPITFLRLANLTTRRIINNEDGRTGAGVHVALAFGAHVTVWWKKAPLNNIYPNAACIEDNERYDPTSLGRAAFSKTGHMLQ